MRVRLKDHLLVVTAESIEERRAVAAWAATLDGHAFALVVQDRVTFRLWDLGPKDDACRKPINVTSRAQEPAIRLISNLAHTPFELDGRPYASVEAFWQGLTSPEESRRREIAPLHGLAAKRAGLAAPDDALFEYGGRQIRAGTADHWRLMARACSAKFTQHEAARAALLGTRARPLTHRTRRDSRRIPGVILADIWMTIRNRLDRGSVDR